MLGLSRKDVTLVAQPTGLGHSTAPLAAVVYDRGASTIIGNKFSLGSDQALKIENRKSISYKIRTPRYFNLITEHGINEFTPLEDSLLDCSLFARVLYHATLGLIL